MAGRLLCAGDRAVGQGDLDELMGMLRLRDPLGRPLLPALQQQLIIDDAASVAVEAVCVHVFERLQAKVPAAAGIRPVQERAVLGSLGHACSAIGGRAGKP